MFMWPCITLHYIVCECSGVLHVYLHAAEYHHMLPWLDSFCSDIRNDFGKAVDVDGLVGPATDVPLLLWVLGQ